ncbi:MAG: helix-turn-helix domain-containing protein [Candidatus Omnitrophica bacterium]|nr:helix-turn-helix domain-containing protein [Candidatus Omnitrophota bacterium]
MTIGAYIRRLRTVRNIGQRELARKIGVSASYLNDIENGKRKGPSKRVIEKIAHTVEANLEYLYDLAGKGTNRIPLDIPEIVKHYSDTVELLRLIKNHDLSKASIKKAIRSIREGKMKAIIIAAGKGSRLRKYTEELPKCMLKFGGKTLLKRQIEALNANGITNISLVKGYKKEKINYPNIKYYINDRFEYNNILNSLFYAEQEMDQEVIISYSDILYEKKVVSRLMESRHDISIVVDIEWQSYYKGRSDHPVQEAENVIFDSNNKVREIGKILTEKHDLYGEFIGMIKLTKRGTDIFKRHFHRAKQLFLGKPFIRAATFEKAYLTDMIQDMVDMGVDVHCVIVPRGWKEIDTVEDYEKAVKKFNEEK